MLLRDIQEIRYALTNFFNNHKLVKLFMFGDLKDFTAKAGKTYLAVNVEYINTVPSARFARHIFNITVADRMDPNNRPSIEQDVIVRTSSIITDTAAMLGMYNTYSLSTIQPFREADGDMLAGVVAAIGINTPISVNNCLTPIN